MTEGEEEEEEVKLKTPVLIAFIWYNPNEKEYLTTVKLTNVAIGMLNTLTDFELKVFAAETSLAVRQVLEMPLSPNPKS